MLLASYPSSIINQKMNGYSRISGDTSHKSRSMVLTPFPQTPKASRNTDTVGKAEAEAEAEEGKKRKDEGDDKGERFGVILGRSASVSSSASGFQVTLKRTFSMRRPSSVSERYCRIHDQYTAIASPSPPIGDHEIDADVIMGTRRSKKKQRGGKILKACKRILGL
ncbi:hypothetical protein E2542_SST00130 [Spatholobus suberectus]|nr:hypothetical protein E2542_SST00130 [Spatholobus suberectus]